jgi:hypothetical protein
MPKRKSTNHSGNPRPSKRNRLSPVSTHPPQISSNLSLGHVFRFVSSNATLTSVTASSLLAAAGGICTTTNTSLTSTFQSVKVNFVRIWSPPAVGVSTTCSVEWIGGQNVNNKEVSDTSNSPAFPAMINSRPPSRSLASFWTQYTTTPLFRLVAPVGSIIDIGLSLVMQDDDATILTTSIATGVLGNTYYLSADSNATHYYVPVSLTTTT